MLCGGVHIFFGSMIVVEYPNENVRLGSKTLSQFTRQHYEAFSVEPKMLRGNNMHDKGAIGISIFDRDMIFQLIRCRVH